MSHNWNYQKHNGPDCIKHFHWLFQLFWPVSFDLTNVSIGNNCKVKPDWQESQEKVKPDWPEITL